VTRAFIQLKKNDALFFAYSACSAFGTVYKGVCRGKTVAIKKLHQQSLDKDVLEEFKKEVEIMTYVQFTALHQPLPNRFLAVIWDTPTLSSSWVLALNQAI